MNIQINMIQQEFFNDFYSIPEGADTQECPKCNVIKPIESFRERVSKEGKGVIVRRIKTCRTCEIKITALLLALQQTAPPKPDKCECCGNETDVFHLDHCHTTEIFRGWLCLNCNVGIGRLGDNVAGIKKALDYLLNAALLVEENG